MAKIVTLKDNNDNIAYPITPVDAVFVDSNTTLSDELNDKADADLSNVDWSSYQGEQFIGRFTTGSSFTLPAGYKLYHIRGRIGYGSCSSNVGMWIIRNNFSGTSWCRRLNCTSSGASWYEYSYTDGHFTVLGSSDALTTSSGSVVVDMTINVHNTLWQMTGNFSHAGAQNSGVIFSETTTSNASNNTTLTFTSTGRTFSNMDIVVTGVLQ